MRNRISVVDITTVLSEVFLETILLVVIGDFANFRIQIQVSGPEPLNK